MTHARPTRVPERAGEWLALGAASRQLGVDPDTLRRWADIGRVRVYATPGGHRRFAREDLERLQRSRRTRRRLLATLGATPERVSRAYARSYRGGTAAAAAMPADLGALERDAFREGGRRLVETMLAYLDTASAARRRALEAEAQAAVAETAARLAGAGATVATAVEAFIAARRPFLGQLEALGRRRALAAPDSTALYAEAAGLFDRLLVRFVAAFQAAGEAP